ncbi:MAG: signal peptidase I [Candidatus Nanohaloarchaea archaeon]|nr:signal peptidase I [Candidatus Nanohaloarchaea archaeon]
MGFKKLLSSNLFFLVVAILLAFGMYQTLGTALGTKVPIVSVVSPSMEPEFYRGDLVIVKDAKIEDLESGDDGSILVFRSKYMPMPIIHRVIDKSGKSVETKGDSNNNQVKVCVDSGGVKRADNGCGPGSRLVNVEKNITQDQILGKAVFVIPNVGHLKLYPTCLFLKATMPDNHPRVEYTCRN